MNYRIEIVDKENETDPLILEHAERDSISLEWLGGDDEKQLIVGSQIAFTMEVGDARDGAFDQYFTSKEQRYLAQIIEEGSDDIIWQGYLLPESYSEPYRGAIFYVNFDATDGLGLLKGKKLPDQYYKNEYSVIEYLRQVIKLTGLELPIYFSPAIVNSNEDNWDEIYLDGLDFVDDDNQIDAYDILKQILNSIRCQIYQAENRWYIEGFNKRQLISQKFKVYNVNNNAFFKTTVEKNIKELTYLPTPDITMIPPVGQINVSQEYEPLDTKDTLTVDEDNPWIVNDAIIQPFWYSDKWSLQDKFRPQIRKPNNKLVTLYNLAISDQNVDQYFTELVKPFYVQQGQRINFDIDITQLGNETLPEDVITDEFEEDIQNRQIFEILLNDKIISTNRGASLIDKEYLEYNSSGNAKADFDVEIDQTGILQMRLCMPKGTITYDSGSGATTIYGGSIWNKLKITNVASEDTINVSKVNDEFSSITNDVELEFADNPLLTNKTFRLKKQREIIANGNIFWFEIIDYNLYEGDLYAQVPIRCAVLAKQFQNIPSTLMHVNDDQSNIGQFINGNEILFNWLGGETHVINLGNLTSFAKGHIYIDVKGFEEATSDRSKWQQWSDDVAQSRNNRYAEVVANIEQKLFLEPNYKQEAETDVPVKYNDVIRFRYKDIDRYFTPTNCAWFPDGGTSNVTLQEMKYNGRRAVELNTFVDAGPDRFLPATGAPNDDQIYYDTSIISTPSGTIQNVEFIEISADGNYNISTNNLTPDVFIFNLDGDNYEFELKVTDSNGNVASDTFKIIRQAEKNVNLQLLPSESFNNTNTLFFVDNNIDIKMSQEKQDTYQLFFSPNLQSVEVANITFDVLFNALNNYDTILKPLQPGDFPGQKNRYFIDKNTCRITVEKNGIEIYRWERKKRDLQDDRFNLEKINNIVQSPEFITTGTADIIKFKLYTYHELNFDSDLILSAGTPADNVISSELEIKNITKLKIKNVEFLRDNIKQNTAFLPKIKEIQTNES